MSDIKEKKNDITGKVESLIIFRCNCRCIMCSTGLQIDRSIGSSDYHAIRPIADVKKDIDRAKKMKATGFAFSGGEPTLRKDLAELAAYAKKVGLKHIEVQSNGRMYSYKEYCQKLIDAGVNHFVISFHSHIRETHDLIMGVPGTYDQALAGIKNLNDLGQPVKINVVLTRHNYQGLEEHMRFLSQFKLAEVRFTMTMAEGNVRHDPRAVMPAMSEAGPYIGRAIDVIKDQAGCFIYNMVPCLTPGYERFVNDLGQYDTLLIGPEFESSLDESRKSRKIKSKACDECVYTDICYGIWKNYAEVFGLDELKPVKGKK